MNQHSIILSRFRVETKVHTVQVAALTAQLHRTRGTPLLDRRVQNRMPHVKGTDSGNSAPDIHLAEGQAIFDIEIAIALKRHLGFRLEELRRFGGMNGQRPP
ncbi:MAG: hypothetical protein BWY63_03593 [Chloroflexi bacterium ADurb.Bin360]|nr:MAG: hypothetical protein BWY63_03593 [Chloroflexi bacterium ADurb.Bin360]